MKNRYIIRSRISEKKFREILRYFCLDLEAVKIAEICKISRNSINKILKEIRKLMASECEKISKMKGEIELDESYFLLRNSARRHKKSERQKRQRSKQKNTCFWYVKKRF